MSLQITGAPCCEPNAATERVRLGPAVEKAGETKEKSPALDILEVSSEAIAALAAENAKAANR